MINSINHQIRNLINDPIKQFSLLKNKKYWNMLCSSMDTIDDSQGAIDHFINSEFPQDNGGKYLYIYGLLQALYIQQDAVRHLNLSLGTEINYKRDFPELYQIRELRNDIVGHPTNRNDGKSFHFISQITLSKEYFQVLDAKPKGVDAIKNVKPLELIKTQEDYLIAILKNKYTEILNELNAFRKKQRMDKLSKHFERGLSYEFEKLFEITNDNSYHNPIPKISFGSIVDRITNVKNDLINRFGSLSVYDGIKYCIEDIDFLTEYLGNYINHKIDVPIKVIYFLILGLKIRIGEFESMCREIDDEMKNDIK